MERKIIGDPLDRRNRNNHNENYEYIFSLLVDTVNKIKEEISQETLDQVIEESRVNWLEAVNTEDDLPTDANVGDAVFVISNNKAYRYNGEDWVFFQALDSSAIDAFAAEMVSQLGEFASLFEDRFDDLKESTDTQISEIYDDMAKIDDRHNYKGVEVELTSDVAVVSDTWHKVVWDKTKYNLSGFWTSNSKTRLTIPEGVGKVRLSCGVLWGSNNDGTRRVRLLKNNGYVDGGFYLSQVAGGTSPLGATSSVVEVNAGDYFELQVYQTSGDKLDLRSDPYTWFSLEVVEYGKK